jgi:putative membrane protein insertion efficiency factor
VSLEAPLHESRNPLLHKVFQVWDVLWVRGLGRLLALVLIAPIKLYQVALSPALGARCKYHPSCSRYAEGALHVHGPGKGLLLGSWRLLRCNPLSKGGVDPVPERCRWLPDVLPNGRPRPRAVADGPTHSLGA